MTFFELLKRTLKIGIYITLTSFSRQLVCHQLRKMEYNAVYQ